MRKDITLDSQGSLLETSVYYPEPVAAKKIPLVVVVPGGNGRVWMRDGALFAGPERLAESFSMAGFCSVIFNCRGQGKSTGMRSMANAAEDLGVVLDFALGRMDPALAAADVSRVGVMGSCFGGSVVSKHCGEDNRVSSVALYGTTPSWKRCMFGTPEIVEKWKSGKREANVRIDFDAEVSLMDEGTFDLDRTLPRLRQHVLVANGTEDTKPKVGYKFSDYLPEMLQIVRSMQHARSVLFALLGGGNHVVNYDEPAWDSYVRLVTTWFQATL